MALFTLSDAKHQRKKLKIVTHCEWALCQLPFQIHRKNRAYFCVELDWTNWMHQS